MSQSSKQAVCDGIPVAPKPDSPNLPFKRANTEDTCGVERVTGAGGSSDASKSIPVVDTPPRNASSIGEGELSNTTRVDAEHNVDGDNLVRSTTEALNTAESDDEGEPLVANPSRDIRGDLENALEGDIAESFTGSHSFHQAYPNAPDPGLCLLANDIGTVKLPLSTRDAELVRSGCRQAPFGQGERTIVDTTVRDTWEMDANQVQFNNPAWTDFLQGIVNDVCAELGVDTAISQPRCELYKLLLYETGSHFLPHVDTEKADNMFATIVIVLPSKYTGGAAHLSHGLLSDVYDTAPLSELQTTAIAWFTDVKHEIKPITSGFRLALSYNLLHTANTLRPTLADDHPAVHALRHILLSWKHAHPESAPCRIFYLLDHEYSQANLKGSSLKGMDAHRSSILDVLAKQLGFRLGLASVEYTLSGYGEADEETEAWYSQGDLVEFLEVVERTVSVSNFVTLDGDKLRDRVDFDENSDVTIPEGLLDAVESGPCERQDYEGYCGNDGGSLDRWYRRTVLIIWPKACNLKMTFDDDINEAVGELASVERGVPHRRERKLVEFLLDVAKGRPKRREVIAETLVHVACKWTDISLYERVIATCGASVGAKLFRDGVLFGSIEMLGFPALRPSLEGMLQAEHNNFDRFRFINSLQDWSLTQATVPKEIVHAWIIEQRQYMMEHLLKPTPNDCQVLIDVALRCGGYHVFQEIFVPQLKCSATDDQFIASMVMALHHEKIKHTVSPEDQSVIAAIVTDLLSDAIEKADFFEPTYLVGCFSPQPALHYVKLVLAVENEQLVERITQRLTDVTNISPALLYRRVEEALLGLMPCIDAIIKVRPVDMPIVPSIQHFYETTIDLYTRTLPESDSSVPTWRTRACMENLLNACCVHGGIDVLHKKIWPALKDWEKCKANVYLALVEKLQTHRDQLPPPSMSRASVDLIIAEAIQMVIQRTEFTSCNNHDDSDGVQRRDDGGYHNRKETITLLGLCLSTGNHSFYDLVFKRLIDPLLCNRYYIEKALVPFLPELRQFLTHHQIAPVEPPFSRVFKSIIMLWVNEVLGPKPKNVIDAVIEDLRGHSCKCAYCNEVFAFLTSSCDKTYCLKRMSKPKRKHMEQELNRYASTAAAWSVISNGRGPQDLKITKAESFHEFSRWETVHAKGSAILKSVSTDNAELQKILDTDYQVVMDTLAGRVGTITIAPPTTSNANAGGASQYPSLATEASSACSVAAAPLPTSTRDVASVPAPSNTETTSQISQKRKRDVADGLA